MRCLIHVCDYPTSLLQKEINVLLERSGKNGNFFLYTIYSINIIKVCTRLNKVYFIIAIVAHVSDVAYGSLVK